MLSSKEKKTKMRLTSCKLLEFWWIQLSIKQKLVELPPKVFQNEGEENANERTRKWAKIHMFKCVIQFAIKYVLLKKIAAAFFV